MPTIRPRYTVTESDALKRALDGVARTHPELEPDRNALFRQLVDEAVARYDDADTTRRERVRMALARMEQRRLTYPPGYLSRLREEWPE